MKRAATILVIVLLLIVPGASAQGAGQITRHVISAGGTSSGRLWGIIGQPVAGRLERLCSGFWCGYTSAAATIVGVATVLAHYTFGDVGIGAMILVTLALVGSRGIYDIVRQVWVQRQSRSRPARSS